MMIESQAFRCWILSTKCKKVTEKWHIYIMFLFNWIKLTKFQHPFWMPGELLSECSIFELNFSSFIPPPPEIARGSYMPWVFVQYLILIELDLNVFLTVQNVFFKIWIGLCTISFDDFAFTCSVQSCWCCVKLVWCFFIYLCYNKKKNLWHTFYLFTQARSQGPFDVYNDNSDFNFFQT